MASRVFSLLSLAAIGGLVLLAPTAPAMADEDPGYRAPRTRSAPPPHRVRTVVNTRTVWRTRTVCYDYSGNPFDCRRPAPVAPAPQIIGYTYSYTCGGCAAPAPVQYYAPPVAAPCGTCAPAAYLPPPVPRYYSGCGGCAQPAPQYVYVQSHGYYGQRHHRHHGHGHYGYAAQ